MGKSNELQQHKLLPPIKKNILTNNITTNLKGSQGNGSSNSPKRLIHVISTVYQYIFFF